MRAKGYYIRSRKAFSRTRHHSNQSRALLPLLQISNPVADAQVGSAVAVIVGTIFVLFQLRQNNKLISATAVQAQAAATQAQLSNDQMKQNNDLANMDLVMRLYEFANTVEVQSSWHSVLHQKVTSREEWLKLPKSDQVAFYQIAALFESLGVLVDRGFVALDVIDDTFQVELAWQSLEGFITAMRRRFGEEETYVFFEKLVRRLAENRKTKQLDSPSSPLK
jgi:hypothetical protein